MHCPHCGEENQESNRYCVGCGSALTGTDRTLAAPVSLKQRIEGLIGNTRRARLVTAATVIAVIVAVAAFIAFEPSKDNAATNDAYTRALDQACALKKRTIGALEQQTVQQQPPDIGRFAGALVLIVEEWRSDLRQSPPPPIHASATEAYDQALLDVLIQAGALARVARSDSSARVAAKAQSVDSASASVDRAIEELGLAQCADLDLGLASVKGS